MVAVIHEWRENPLARLRALMPKEIRDELDAVRRRLFVPMIVVQLYDAPFHRYEDQDELGQWADDGGRCADS